MKDIFPEYYHNPDLENLFSESLFVFDSCAILQLYHSKKEITVEVFQVLEDPQVIDRIRIPHQVALEYQRNRFRRIIDYENANNISMALGNINTKIKDVFGSIDAFKTVLNNVSLTQESNIDLNDSLENISTSKDDLEEIQKRFLEIKKTYKPAYLFNDEIRDKIDNLFENKIGDSFTSEELIEIYKEGEDRYKNKIPPGYLDANKKTNKKYGDLVIWKQIINCAKSEDKDIIFITNDEKEDWWFLQPYTNKRLGPQAELVNEFVSKTERRFHMFTLKEFLPEINDKLNLGQNSETLKRVGLTETSRIYQVLRDASTTASVLSNPGMVYGILEMAETARMAQQATLDAARAASSLSNSNMLSEFHEMAETARMAQQVTLEAARAASSLSNSNMLSEFHEMAETARMAQQVTLEAARAASALSNKNILQEDDDEVDKEEDNEEKNMD